MQRQKDENIASRVYTYGAVPARIAPVLGEDKALDQMRLAQRLWNVLVAIDRARMEGYRRIMRDAVQDRIDALREQADALRGEIKARRKQARKRSVDVADLMEALAAVKAEIDALIQMQKDTSGARHDARRAELAALQERTYKRITRARQAAGRMGLFWGTYNDIVQRADAGRKHGGELHFRGFHGEGTLTAQIMGGAAVERCAGGEHTFFAIDPPDEHCKWRYARMRIGSNKDRSPVWLQIPIVYHRPLPENGTIKSVSMSRRILAGKTVWQLNATVNTAAPALKHRGVAVAIDIGWRLMEEGVRVAYWLDERGAHGQVLVPMSDVREFERVSSLRSTCDRARDEFLPALAAWLGGVELPAEWAERTACLPQWRSTARVSSLVAWWREHRLPGDEEIYLGAAAWRRENLHLSGWWRNLQDQLVRRLRERYRVFAAHVAREYGTVCIEEFDLSEVARRPAPEDGPETSASSTYRQAVSPSAFRGALLNALGREGARVLRLPAEYSTRTCHECGYNGKWDAAPNVMHRCGNCGKLFDQDYNAAANLLAMGTAEKAATA